MIDESEASELAVAAMSGVTYELPALTMVRMGSGWVASFGTGRPPGDPVVVVSDSGRVGVFDSSVPPEVALLSLEADR